VDNSALCSMKNVANCDNPCDLQNLRLIELRTFQPLVYPEVGLVVCHKHPLVTTARPDYPLNLSILIRGGKEINRDSLSKGD